MVERAVAALRRAETAARLRQCLAILIPIWTGAGIGKTAALLGVSEAAVRRLRHRFAHDGAGDQPTATRGGRRRALLPIEQERSFVTPWIAQPQHRGELDVAAFRAAYEERVGRTVAKSTIYRLLARHGWRPDEPASAARGDAV